jgi:hypothetical protein
MGKPEENMCSMTRIDQVYADSGTVLTTMETMMEKIGSRGGSPTMSEFPETVRKQSPTSHLRATLRYLQVTTCEYLRVTLRYLASVAIQTKLFTS